MNDNIAGFMTCPICHETHQELRINKNRILYMFCDNGCAVKLNRPKSKRYLPVLLSGSDVKDEQFGLISAAKGKKQDEIKEKGRYLAAGRTAAANDNGTTGSSTGSFAGRTAAAGNDSRTTGSSTGSDIIGRPNGQHTTAGNDSIFGRAAKWLAADDDDDE